MNETLPAPSSPDQPAARRQIDRRQRRSAACFAGLRPGFEPVPPVFRGVVECDRRQVRGRAVFQMLVEQRQHHFAAELLDFVACDLAEVFVERFAGFKLGTVYQDCIGPRKSVSEVIMVPEKCEPAIFQRGGAVVIFALEPGDVLVDEF